MSESPLLIDVRGVGKVLGISARQVWRLRDQGLLPAPVRLNSSVRWRVEDIEDFVDAGCAAEAVVGAHCRLDVERRESGLAAGACR